MLSSGGAKGPKPGPLTEAALRQFIAKALDKDWIRESFHSEVERADRNISHDDVIHGLERNWTLIEVRPPTESWHKGYSYKLQTVDLETDELILVVCPDLETQTLKVATKF